MTVEFLLLRNTYYDSVFLMSISGRLGKQPDIRRTAALMATPKNRVLLAEFGVSAGLLAAAGPSNLGLAVDAATGAAGTAALALVDGWLHEETARPAAGGVTSLEAALQVVPDAGLAVISVPGEYAAYEARRALEHGLNVFLFSDNVALADEIALKQEAQERGLLVMGPDCGTALLAGAGIGFANVVRRGAVGIVGPSGTGIQQVSSLVHQLGGGVSHAIGTGSHDLSDDVGGITTLQALAALDEDPDTAAIAIVSKPPGEQTRRRVLEWIAGATKPVVTCFLGEDAGDQVAVGALHHPRRTLAETAEAVVRLAGDPPFPAPDADGAAAALHDRLAVMPVAQRHVRGLFAGGTFCYEAQQILGAAGIRVSSNAPLRENLRLPDPWRSTGHSLVDLGDDVFTQGRPHPMIDAGLRNERLVAEAADPEVALILLDFILGHGAAADPAGDTLPAIRAAQELVRAAGRDLVFVASVCGTDADPQDRARQVALLQEAGVVPAASSSAAAGLVARLIAQREQFAGAGVEHR